MKTIAIIPARYASTRLPGKPLALIAGKPIIEHVYQRVSSTIDKIYVATDDIRIADVVTHIGGRVIMTDNNLNSGTERCAAALNKLDFTPDYVINIQGDEPLIEPKDIIKVKNLIETNKVEIATLARQFNLNEGFDTLASPNTVKVVTNSKMEALYFSRSIIPYMRDIPYNEWINQTSHLIHLGIYAYKATTLRHITSLPQTPIEIAEKLEQLRWLHAGINIHVALTNNHSIGIDTQEDLEKVRKIFESQE